MNTPTTITGQAAIDFARKHGLKLSKYNDPVDPARFADIDPDDPYVDEVMREDPRLIYVDVMDLAPSRVIIYVSGGLVQAVRGTSYVEVDVYDKDNHDAEPDSDRSAELDDLLTEYEKLPLALY